MKVIVAGSRSITDENVVWDLIEKSSFVIGELVSGGARGVDKAGESYAVINQIPIKQFLPDWKKNGKVAGYLRNKEMGNYANALIAIWDGESKGTRHMIDYMKEIDKPLEVFVELREGV